MPDQDTLVTAADEVNPMLTAADVMTAAPRTWSRFSTVLEAVLIFRDADCGLVPVVDGGKPIGVLTDRDVALALADYKDALPCDVRRRRHEAGTSRPSRRMPGSTSSAGRSPSEECAASWSSTRQVNWSASSPGRTWSPTCPNAVWADSSIRSLTIIIPRTETGQLPCPRSLRTGGIPWHNEHHDKERWTSDGLYYEYSKAANPIGEGLTTKVPMADFPHHLHESGPTRIIPFDLSHELKCPGPATSPALCSNFIRIRQGEHIRTTPNATSELYYVIRGKGRTRVHGEDIRWEQGRFPHAPGAEHGGALRR